jgi:hypothetical protein
MTKRLLLLFTLLCLVPALLPAAPITYKVSLDISELVGQGDFQTYFQFIDASGSSAIVSNLSIAPGLELTFPNPPGSFLTEESVPFTATDPLLQFFVTLDKVLGPVDFFGFGLNQSDGTPFATNDSFGTNLLLAIDLSDEGPQVVTYNGIEPLTTAPVADQVPEPGSSILLVSAAAILAAFRRHLRPE